MKVPGKNISKQRNVLLTRYVQALYCTEGITPLLINIMLSRKTHTDIAAIRVIALYVREVSEAT
jgi:hypothetical protein